MKGIAHICSFTLPLMVLFFAVSVLVVYPVIKVINSAVELSYEITDLDTEEDTHENKTEDSESLVDSLYCYLNADFTWQFNGNSLEAFSESSFQLNLQQLETFIPPPKHI